MNEPLYRLWTATVARSPSELALVEAATGKRWTRAALAAAACGWADFFTQEAGKTKPLGRRVAMSVPNGAGWFEAFLGLLSVGAIPVPIDPLEPEDAQRSAARSVGAAFLWRDGRLDRVAAGRRVAAVPGECLVKLTSGSSGSPKALPVTHAQMEADGRQICASMGIGPDDANLAAIPLGYSYGLGNLVIPFVVQGTRIICLSSPLPHAVAAASARFKPTVFPAVPPILKALAGSELDRRSLASLRLVISAGSPLDPEVARDFAGRFGVKIHSFYGTSETGGIAFDRSGDATLAGRSVGTPIDRVNLAFGKAGRFVVSSPAVVGKGRFSPADRAHLSAGGELVLSGRADRVVKVAGRRLDLAEIEAALRALPGVDDAFAHMPGGAEGLLSAAVATRQSVADLKSLLRARIASWKVPTRLVTLTEFPATSRGKPDGRRLRQLLSAPRTATSISTLRAARQMSAPR
jgi:long-chain acyl-CoA synthetase